MNFLLFGLALLFSFGWVTQIVAFVVIAGSRQAAFKIRGFHAFMASLLWTLFYWSVS